MRWYYAWRAWEDTADKLSDCASGNPVDRWVIGVGAAVPLALYAVICLVTRQALVPRGKPAGIDQVWGSQAIAAGVIYLSAALFMHCHWFWSAHPRFHGYGQLGKIVGLIGFIGGLGYWFYKVFILG